MPGAHPVSGAAQCAALSAAAATAAARLTSALLGDAAGDDGSSPVHGRALGQVSDAIPDLVQERSTLTAAGSLHRISMQFMHKKTYRNI